VPDGVCVLWEESDGDTQKCFQQMHSLDFQNLTKACSRGLLSIPVGEVCDKVIGGSTSKTPNLVIFMSETPPDSFHKAHTSLSQSPGLDLRTFDRLSEVPA